MSTSLELRASWNANVNPKFMIFSTVVFNVFIGSCISIADCDIFLCQLGVVSDRSTSCGIMPLKWLSVVATMPVDLTTWTLVVRISACRREDHVMTGFVQWHRTQSGDFHGSADQRILRCHIFKHPFLLKYGDSRSNLLFGAGLQEINLLQGGFLDTAGVDADLCA